MIFTVDMNSKQVYYYHIITCADIEEELKQRQVYPLVHFKDETCQTKCYQTETNDSRGDIPDSDATQQPGGTSGDCGQGSGRVRDGIQLGRISGTSNSELCPGNEGIGHIEGDGSFRVEWRNGRTRRYSVGGGSCERIGDDLGGVGQDVRAVGAYITSPESNLSTIYNGPYKLIAYHHGTARRHWHIIYISNNKQWGVNSRLGRIIRKGTYKNSSINCVSCLREYLYSGNGRQILQDILSEEHIEACKCAWHSCGVDSNNKWTKTTYEIDDTPRRNSIHGNESATSEEGLEGVVDAADKTNERNVPKRLWSRDQVLCEDGENLYGGKVPKYTNDNRKDCEFYSRNRDLILLLCDNGAFTESEAMEIFAQSPEGIEFMCSKQFGERIKSYIHIARILVFQESLKQRFERAKMKYMKEEKLNDEIMDKQYETLVEILKNNRINEEKFAYCTFNHMSGNTGKRNNLFFIGPPSTGKTMIMTSLIECHFNYCRLTGLTPNSSFNFSGLLHCNAVLMDECKLTENQFEQWKLLASRMPMSTDVKYKDRCDVGKCILYTSSNYPIEMYCKVPMAKQAIDERTLQFNFNVKINGYTRIAPHIWEKFWNKYNFII